MGRGWGSCGGGIYLTFAILKACELLEYVIVRNMMLIFSWVSGS